MANGLKGFATHAAGRVVSGKVLCGAVAIAAAAALLPSGCADEEVAPSCSADGAVEVCTVMVSHTDSTVTCGIGTTECSEGTWSSCDTYTTVTRDHEWGDDDPSPYSTMNLGASQPCNNNPCNIYCNEFGDTPGGMVPPPGMEVDANGLTLSTNSSAVGADGLQIVPDDFPVTVTTIPSTGPLTWTPTPVTFEAWFTNSGAPVLKTPATWRLDSYVYSLIDGGGIVDIIEPIPHVATVKAEAATYGDDATLSVIVDALETLGGPPQAILDEFEKPAAGPATTDVLYPYDNTVFPRSIAAPTIMWDASDTAQWVRTCLIFNDPGQGGARTFRWCKVEPEPNPKRTTLEQRAWTAFDTAAAGQSAAITVQRIVSGTQVAQYTIPISFSSEAMRGTVYFWDLAQENISKIKEDGSLIQSILPMPNGTSCIGCHSFSADGTTLVGMPKDPRTRATWDITVTPAVNDWFDPISYDFKWTAASPTGAFTLGSAEGDTTGFSKGIGYLLDSYSPTQYQTISHPNGLVTQQMWSPVGDHVAYALRDNGGDHQLCTFDLGLSSPYPVTNHSCLGSSPQPAAMPYVHFPTFTPDGEYIAFNIGEAKKWKDSNRDMLYGTSRTAPNFVPLARANGVGPGNADPADHHYNASPRISPVAGADHNWMLFASRRAYGNILGSDGEPQLWISALNKNPTAVPDPSSPAFYLPGQPIGDPNLEPFFTASPCLPVGDTCKINDDCCGYDSGTPSNSSAKCVIDQPLTYPVTRSCKAFTPNTCQPQDAVCSLDADCCNFPDFICVLGTCQPSAQPPMYGPGTFTRDYESVCGQGSTIAWTIFKWRALTPGDSSIVFTAYTADSQADLATATPAPLATSINQTGVWNLVHVGSKLPGELSEDWLRIDMTLNPTSDLLQAPTLIEWTLLYDCLQNT